MPRTVLSFDGCIDVLKEQFNQTPKERDEAKIIEAGVGLTAYLIYDIHSIASSLKEIAKNSERMFG